MITLEQLLSRLETVFSLVRPFRVIQAQQFWY